MDRLKITAAQVDKAGCAAPFNDVAQYFNRKLKEVVVQLRKDLPLAAITYVDVYSVKYSLISQARKHGKPSIYPINDMSFRNSFWFIVLVFNKRPHMLLGIFNLYK